MDSAFAFELPQDEEYSDFIEIEGSKSLVFARYERHRAVVTTGTGFKLEAERPEEEEKSDDKSLDDNEIIPLNLKDDDKIIPLNPPDEFPEDLQTDHKQSDEEKADA